MRGVNAIADLVSEGSATSEVKLAMGGVTVEGSGRFPQAQAVSVGRLEDSVLKGAGYTAVDDVAIAIPGGFASATNAFLPHPIDGMTVIGSETMRTDTTATSVVMKDIEFTVALDPSSASEAAGTGFEFTATVTSDEAVDGDVFILIQYQNGSAIWGNDYTAGSGLRTEISDGLTEGTFDLEINIIEDVIPEGDETVVISVLIDPLGPDNTVTITENFTITDNDGPAPMLPTSITFSVSPTTVAENGERVTVTATATIDGDNRFPSERFIIVTVGKSGDSAVKITDYTDVNDVTITIAADAPSGTQTFILNPIDNDLTEGNKTISVEGSVPGSAITVTPATITITITDDETPASTLPTSITLSVSPSSVAENVGTATSVTVTATVDGNARFSQEQTVTASVGKSGDSAVEGTDYTMMGDVTITIDADAASGTGTFTLTPMNDSIFEGNETISVEGSVTGSAVTVTPATITITITDDETQSTALVLTLGSNSAEEDVGTANIGVTVRLNNDARPMPTPVTITVTDGTASSSDYSVSSTVSLQIAAGMTEITGTVPIVIANDDATESDETVTITASSTGLTSDSENFTITANDAPTLPTSITLSVSPSSVAENAPRSVMVTATVDGNGRFPQEQTVTATVGKSGDSAVEGTDYMTVNTVTITIAADAASGTGTFTLSPINDTIPESNETISVEGSVAGSTVTVKPATITITDNDTPAPTLPTSITLSVSPSSVAENAARSVTVTATVDGNGRFPQEQTVTATVGKSGDSAVEGTDYMTVNTVTITIAADAASGTGTFTLSPINDTIPESNETISVEGSVAGSTVTVKPATITITDNDTPAPTLPTSITLSVSPSSVAENAARSVTVTARVDGNGRFPQAQMVTATVGKSGDSAVEGTDYTTVNNVTIRIDANAASGTGSFMLTPMNDSIYEGSETISVEGSVASSTVTVKPATITITDNDTQSTALVLTLGSNSAEEDVGTANVGVTVRLNNDARPIPTPVTIRITDGTASSSDYSVSSPVSLQIPMGMTEITGTVPISIANDDAEEGDETVTITASTTGLTSDSENFTIRDDDAAPTLPTSITLSVSPSSVAENAEESVTVTATLDGNGRFLQERTLTAMVGKSGDSAVEGTDYMAVDDVTITIAADAASGERSFTLTPINDNISEGSETISVEGNVTGSAVTVTPATITITDNDAQSTALVLTLNPARLHEDSGTSWVRFTAGLDGVTRTMDTPVELRVTAGTAIENADYRTPVVPTSLMISSGETSLSDSLQMVITDNDTMEGNKTVVIEVSATGLNAATQELVIVDNESAVRVDTLMAEVNATGGYTITTPVRQNMGAPVTSVVLHYGDGMTFEMAPMEMSSEGSYTAELMAPEEGDILYYYVLATNEDGLTTTYPPEGRYLDISDYTGSSRLVLLDFEDGDAGDKSTVGHAVVYRGGEPTFAEDALVLDGVDDHAEILGSSLGASEEFALEIMFNADDFDAAVLDAGGTYLVSKPVRCAACWEESTFSLLWERSAASGTLLAARFWNPEYGESGQVELEIPMPLASGQWYHAVLEVQRRDAGQRALLRLRDQSGMLHGEDVAVLPALPVISTYPIFVGHIGDRGFFDGRIDDVGFYNYAHFGLSLASSEDAWEVPEGYVLEQNYPNPFNPVTTIRYDLAKVGHVHLEVSDLLGRRVTVLVDAVQEAGAQEVRFDARDLPSGMYLYRLRVEDFVSVKKMVLLK